MGDVLNSGMLAIDLCTHARTLEDTRRSSRWPEWFGGDGTKKIGRGGGERYQLKQESEKRLKKDFVFSSFSCWLKKKK